MRHTSHFDQYSRICTSLLLSRYSCELTDIARIDAEEYAAAALEYTAESAVRDVQRELVTRPLFAPAASLIRCVLILGSPRGI